MNSFTKRQKELFLVVIASLFFITLSSYSYFIVYSPVKQENNRLKQSAENERDILIALRQEATKKEKSDSTSTLNAQRKVPVKPLEDVVLLQITEAEIKSGTEVKNVTFSKSIADILILPENVDSVSELLTTVELAVNTYPELLKFITEIERMERIFIIDSINFNGPKEVIEVDQVNEPISLSLSFSAFYREDLVNLKNEVPKVSAPSGSDKSNPFSFNQDSEDGEE